MKYSTSIVLFLFNIFIIGFGEKCPEPRAVTISQEPYLVESIYLNNNQNISVPEHISLRGRDIVLNTRDGTYILTKKKKIEKIRSLIRMKKMRSFQFDTGEEISIVKGKGIMYSNSRQNKTNLVFNQDYDMRSLCADTKNNQIYFLCLPRSAQITGTNKLYVYDKFKMKPTDNQILLEEIQGLGYNITDIVVYPITGEIILSSEYIEGEEKFWSLKKLTRIKKSRPIKTRKFISAHSKDILEAAIAQAGSDILRIYEESLQKGKSTNAKNNSVDLECEDMLKNARKNYLEYKNNISHHSEELLRAYRILMNVYKSENKRPVYLYNYETIMNILKDILRDAPHLR